MCLLLRPAGAPAPGARTFFAVGALIACAGLMKPHFMALGLCALAYIAVVRDLSLRRRIVLAAFLAAGASAVVAAVVGWLVINGAFHEFIEAHFLFNLTSYGAQGATLGDAARIVFWYVEQGVIPVLAPFVAAGLWAHRKDRPTLVVLASWLVIAFLTVVVQGKFFQYHWFVMYPPMVICAALGAHAVLQGAQTSVMKVVVAGAVAMFALHVARPPLRDVVQWTKRIAGGSEQAYFASYVFNETYSAADMVAAGRHIRERTKPEDGVFVWGNDAVIRFLAGRRDPTRFTHVLPIESPGPFMARYRAEMMQGLTTDPPAYIVVGGPWVSKQTALGFFPDFTALIAARYVLETTIGHVDLYRLKDHAAVP
jgi:hypothetical protein